MKILKNTQLAVSIALLCSGAAVMAQTDKSGYWQDTRGVIVRSGFNECWRAGYWTPALAVPECEPGMKAPAPAPKAAPAAAPAPVAAAPAPAPAPAPKAVEKTMRLDGANFATGSSKLNSSAGSKLDTVVTTAKQNPDLQFEVAGYTDSAGKAQSNLKLSQARADAVKAYLVGKGVAASRISAKGYGEEHPLADNKTAAGRAQNRRVEVRYTVKE